MGGDSEAPRGHLLHGAAAQIAVGVRPKARRILAALAGVRFAAQAVHGDGQRLVRLLADGAERHRPGAKTLHDFGSGFDFLERDRRASGPEFQQAAQRVKLAVLAIYELRKFLESLELRLTHSVLKLADGLRVQEVPLAAQAELVVPADLELGVRFRGRLHRECMFDHSFASQYIQTHALDARGRAREIPLHHRAVQPDHFEDLRAEIALQGRDPHLGEDLKQALVHGLPVVLEHLVEAVVGGEISAGVEIFQRFDGQIGIDGAGAVADEQPEVHDLARLAGFRDQRHLIARLLPNQVMVHGGERQQARDRRVVLVHAAIGKNQDGVTRLDGQRGLAAQLFESLLHFTAAVHTEKHRQRRGEEVAPTDATQLFQVPIRHDGMSDLERVAMLRRLIQDVAF